MNVEAIKVWAQLIASIGVIVSLFYVAAQIRLTHHIPGESYMGLCQ